jgi:hypothetical protein
LHQTSKFWSRGPYGGPAEDALRLDSYLCRAPVIERMSALQDAYVRVEHEDSNSGDCGDEDWAR